MNYVDTLQKVLIETDTGFKNAIGASYNGMGFYISSTTWNDGKKLVTQEVADAEYAVVQDMGRLPRVVTMDIHIIGDGCLYRKDLLVQEFTQRGYRELVHPYLGVLEARAGTITGTETEDSTKICTMTVTFAIGKQSDTAVFIPNASLAVVQQSRTIRDNILNTYTQIMEQLDSGKAFLSTLNSKVLEINSTIVGARKTVRSIAEYEQIASNIIQSADTTLLNTSALLADAIALVTFTNSEAENVKTNTNELLDNTRHFRQFKSSDDNSYDVEATEIIDEQLAYINTDIEVELPDYLPDTAHKADYNATILAYEKTTKVASLTKVAETVPAIAFESLEDVAYYTESINDAFYNTLALVQDEQEVYNNLQVLQATTLAVLDDVALSLPNTNTMEVPNEMTVLEVVAQRYSDPSNVEEIVATNNIKHPLFIEHGTILELPNE